MKNVLKIASAITLSLLILSCNEDTGIEQELVIENNLVDAEIKKDFEEFALMLSESLDNNNIVDYIYKESSKKFDGDYDILLAKDFSENNLSKSGDGKKINLKTLLSANLVTKNTSSKEKGLESYFDELLEKYPTLQISVPNLETCSSNKLKKGQRRESPLVAYAYNEDKSITAYDRFGNSQELTNDEVPERPVIVISESERVVTTKIGSTLASRFDKYCPIMMRIASRSYDYYRLYNCGINEQGDNGEGNIVTTPHRDFNDNQDKIYKARFKSMNDKRRYESWWLGDAEVRIEIVFATNSNGKELFDSTTKHINHGFIRTKWYGESYTVDNNVNIPIVIWDKEVYGNRMKYVFYEVDRNRGNETVKVAHTTKIGDITISGERSFIIDSTDDHMGDFIVDYNTNTKGDGTQFSTGSFDCWIKQ
jgi:hypothetical protein